MTETEYYNPPLYTKTECEAKIREINDLITAIQAAPASASVSGVGSAHYMGRLADLRKERLKWEQYLAQAVAYEKRQLGLSSAHSLQGPKVSI